MTPYCKSISFDIYYYVLLNILFVVLYILLQEFKNLYLFLVSGYAYDSDCIYVNGTGEDEYEFYIQLNRCGTLGGSDHHKKRNTNAKNRDPTVN